MWLNVLDIVEEADDYSNLESVKYNNINQQIEPVGLRLSERISTVCI